MSELIPEDFTCKHDMPRAWCAICSGTDVNEEALDNKEFLANLIKFGDKDES